MHNDIIDSGCALSAEAVAKWEFAPGRPVSLFIGDTGENPEVLTAPGMWRGS